mmetsp:Transcript_89518/g.253682  ORF Transcript_89518/g.253682 Transcript_89518/m.253682 type:complete len:230 (+) Transcript_89518:296-985(+)
MRSLISSVEPFRSSSPTSELHASSIFARPRRASSAPCVWITALARSAMDLLRAALSLLASLLFLTTSFSASMATSGSLSAWASASSSLDWSIPTWPWWLAWPATPLENPMLSHIILCVSNSLSKFFQATAMAGLSWSRSLASSTVGELSSKVGIATFLRGFSAFEASFTTSSAKASPSTDCVDTRWFCLISAPSSLRPAHLSEHAPIRGSNAGRGGGSGSAWVEAEARA